MEIYLEHPGYLWILVGAIPLLAYAAYKSYALAPKWKRITSLAVRILGITLIVLAVCRPVLRKDKPDETVVFAVDISDSSDPAELESCAEFLAEATASLEEHQRVALVVFAGRARVARSLSSEPIKIADTPIADLFYHRNRKKEAEAQIRAVERDMSGDDAAQRLEEARERLGALVAIERDLDTRETNLRDVLRLARSVLPEDSKRRVVLFSDGNWTRGDPEQELTLMKRAGVTVDTRCFEMTEKNEVIAERIVAPSEAKIREPVEVEVHVNATEARTVTMKFFRDQFLLSSDDIELEAGRNVVRIPKQELEEGFHEFEVVIVAEDDPRPENNIARAVVVVSGRPRVLLVEGQERDARYLEQALRDEDINVEVRPPIGFPESLNDLFNYDVLIMSDVAATDLHTTQLGLVKRYVRDFGGGLIMLGGERSFGLGGYYRTPVEDALPVRMPIKKTIEKPSLGLVIVLDRSGSMSGEKITLAKEAAIASVDVLKKKDHIGVIGFDSVAEWVVELQLAGNRDEIVTQVSRIAAGGGTDIYAGMYRAYEALSQSNCKLKHVILLSDGHTSGPREQCVEIVDAMSSEQITVSTVGIGDADQALLTQMADRGQGEAYFTNDFGSIPQIFTKETMRASKSMLVEEPFYPTATGVQHQMLQGISMEDIPMLSGYVSTTAKERARLLIKSDYGDPILAHWNYGLGRSIAFTSNAKDNWAGDWISWASFGKFWAQAIRSVMSTGTGSVLQQTADIQVDRGQIKVRIDTRDRDGRFVDAVVPKLSVVEASSATTAIDAQHVAPGMYEAELPIEDYGEFVRLRVDSEVDGDVKMIRNYAVVESYPPEYRAATADSSFLEHVARSTDGRSMPTAEDATKFEGDPARGLDDLWRLCVLLAGLLLPLDIALRRLG